MVKDEQRISSHLRDVSPCRDCTEKFLACHDDCPKDKRGEHGYGAWKAKVEEIKVLKKQYLDNFYVRQKWDRR